jgi:hypothetical protein
MPIAVAVAVYLYFDIVVVILVVATASAGNKAFAGKKLHDGNYKMEQQRRSPSSPWAVCREWDIIM